MIGTLGGGAEVKARGGGVEDFVLVVAEKAAGRRAVSVCAFI